MPVRRIGLPGLGRRLRTARLNAGFTQESAAEMVGVSWLSLLRWEHEKRTVPADKLTCLAQLYKVSLRLLLTLDEGDLPTSAPVGDGARRNYDRVSGVSLSAQLAAARLDCNAHRSTRSWNAITLK